MDTILLSLTFAIVLMNLAFAFRTRKKVDKLYDYNAEDLAGLRRIVTERANDILDSVVDSVDTLTETIQEQDNERTRSGLHEAGSGVEDHIAALPEHGEPEAEVGDPEGGPSSTGDAGSSGSEGMFRIWEQPGGILITEDQFMHAHTELARLRTLSKNVSRLSDTQRTELFSSIQIHENTVEEYRLQEDAVRMARKATA